MRRWLLISLLLLSQTLWAAPHPAAAPNKPKKPLTHSDKTKMNHVIALLNQPLDKIQACAHKGIIGYQNALSAIYLVGRVNIRKNLVTAYAWALVAEYQIRQTKQKSLIKAQEKTLKFIRNNLDEAQINQAEVLAMDFVRKYADHWPRQPILKAAELPEECQLHFYQHDLTKNLSTH